MLDAGHLTGDRPRWRATRVSALLSGLLANARQSFAADSSEMVSCSTGGWMQSQSASWVCGTVFPDQEQGPLAPSDTEFADASGA